VFQDIEISFTQYNNVMSVVSLHQISYHEFRGSPLTNALKRGTCVKSDNSTSTLQ